MKDEELKKTWLEEERRAFTGWDFSYLKSRWQQEPLPWDYKSLVAAQLRPADHLLDMGTGGGEFLLTLGHPYENTAVTEAWPPNIELCRKTLVPLGIRLYPVEDDARLPIADDVFDRVINRQTAYDLGEVSRVLKPGGLFITQQVGGDNCVSLIKKLSAADSPPLYQGFCLSSQTPQCTKNGFAILFSDEAYAELRFSDVGAVVFWAKIIEWSFPGFSVERNFAELCALQREIERTGYVYDNEHRFILIAQSCK